MPTETDVFNQSPYPRKPLEATPFDDWNGLFLHCVHTPRYRRDGIHRPGSAPPRILDVGCGSGWKTMLLAAANPGAQILALDPSSVSLDLAARRLARHGVEGVELVQAGLADVAARGQTFDLINCDELLYLLPDLAPADALNHLRGSLAPGGIIRFNLHGRWQREAYFRGQELFRLLGLMDHSPGEKEAAAVGGFMRALAPDTELRKKAWIAPFESENATEHILMNFLLENDKGYSMQDLFLIIEHAGLGFISMVNWDQWRLDRLFENTRLPTLIADSAKASDPSFALRIFELLHPVHRRLDAWAGLPEKPVAAPGPLEDTTLLQLHPVLQAPFFRDAARTAAREGNPLRLRDFIKVSSAGPLDVEAEDLAAFSRLWESPLGFGELTEGKAERFRDSIRRLEAACLLLQRDSR